MIQVALSRATVVDALTCFLWKGPPQRLAVRVGAAPRRAEAWIVEVTGREPHGGGRRRARFALTSVAGGIGSELQLVEDHAASSEGWQGAVEWALWDALCRCLVSASPAPLRSRSAGSNRVQASASGSG